MFLHRLKMVLRYFFPPLSIRFYPQEVVIEVTNHCNLQCVMCPHQNMQRPKGLMDEALFRKIIDEISDKAELVYLFGTGESLIHPKLCDFIDYAASKGLYTVLSTNGMLLDEEASRKLLSSRLDYLIVALDGGTRQTYESIRIKGNFDLLVANIKSMLRIKREVGAKVRTCIQMIYMSNNAHEKKLFMDLFSPQEHRSVEQFRFKPLYETYNLEQKKVKHSRPCFWLWNLMSIYWNGDVALCCMDSDAAYTLGNVKSQKVSDIWNGMQMNALRHCHKRVEYDAMPLCDTCDISEQGYFNALNIVCSVALDAGLVRRIIPLYEKYVLLPLRNRKTSR